MFSYGQTNTPNFIKILFLIPLFGFMVTVSMDIFQGDAVSCESEKVAARKISTGDLSLSTQWSIGIAIDSRSDVNPYISTNGDVLLASQYYCNQLNAFDLVSGEKRWTRQINSNALLISETDNRIAYTTVIDGAKREIHALDVQSGNAIWVNNRYNNARIGIDLQIGDENQLIAYFGTRDREDHIQVLDTITGEPQAIIPNSASTVLYSQGILVEYIGNEVHAINQSSGETVWSWIAPQTVNYNQYFHPVLVGDLLIMRQPTTENALYVLDWNTGEFLWGLQDVNVTSNIAINNGKVYFLVDTRTLAVHDLATGEALNQVQFVVQPNSENTSGSSNWVAVSDELIAIYFADSQTLSVYTYEE